MGTGETTVADKRKPSPDPKGTAAMQARASGPAGSHLAHWPPPMRAVHSKATVTVHRQGEPVQHNIRARNGWRLTRAMFAEFEGEES
jgi:hypothetical protein